MILDFNDPLSIVNWWKVRPVQHGGYLEFKLKASPEFSAGIREAQRRIVTDPALQALLARAVRDERSREAASWFSRSGSPANERVYDRYEELAVA